MKLLLVKIGKDTTSHQLKEHLDTGCYYESEQFNKFLNIVFLYLFLKCNSLSIIKVCTLPSYVPNDICFICPS